MDSKEFLDAVTKATSKWAKQRKAEEREWSKALRRREVLIRYPRTTIKEAAYSVMKSAYLKASANNTLPAHARQVMYAARGPVQEITGQMLDDQYFTQTLLPDYMNDYPDITANWDVVFDARGHFHEPHTGRTIPLGTLEVRAYLQKVPDRCIPLINDADEGDALFPTHGPHRRFSAILFIEKEGFMPLFEKVKLAKRFDIAIMSTKGMSVTAARLLVDRLSEHDVSLLVLRDFDKAGFSIAGTLQRDTRRYVFTRNVEVSDLGLRLTDVEEEKLASESVSYGKSDPTYNLQQNGATGDEIAFLYHGWSSLLGHHGKRVELNAFASDKLVNWIERRLDEQGIQKLVPDAETLDLAYRRALAAKWLEDRQLEIKEEAEQMAREAEIPEGLSDDIQQRLHQKSSLSWDQAIAERVAMEG
jgi:Topoisomerase 6 subunit A/Spo11, Toprim domain